MSSVDADPWDHNTHHHGAIIKVIRAGSESALDVGCGQGALTRRLRDVVPHVTGIDRDERSTCSVTSARPRSSPDHLT
jgi:predicted TPR repeat methyltransferase